MHLLYDNNDGWNLGIGGVIGNSEVVFSITAGGQLQYKSSDIGAINYIGLMKFTAKALQQ